MHKNFKRVTREHPCPICGSIDWCLTSADNTAAICPRVESSRRAGEAGYLHVLAKPVDWKPPAKLIGVGPVEDFGGLARQYQSSAEKCGKIADLAYRLGVSEVNLRRFGIGYSFDGNFWTFPLSEATGTKVIGINRRFGNGEKRVFSGHRTGLYLPADLPADLSALTLLIVEGGSDAVAGLDLGFWTVGRFSCNSGAKLLVDVIRSRRPRLTVIVADTDAVGRRGAESLACAMLPYVASLKVIEPPTPHKDLRSWLVAGAEHAELIALIEDAPVRSLKVRCA
jgi:hypothetical protein